MKRNATLLSMLFVLCANVFSTAKAQIDVNDSLALVDLYKSTNGAQWLKRTNWLTANPVSTWYGVTATGARVTKIKLFNNYLTGTLPASVGNLTAVTSLQLWGNLIAGSLPASLGNLTKLTLLDLSYNKFSGDIPSTIGNLTSLNQLILSYNELSGAIPAGVYNLSQLTDLTLTSNKLTGNIDAAVGNLVNLINLKMDINQLTGTIPATIGKLTNLYYLYVNNNQLTGTIPGEIGNLTKLFGLNMQNNGLSGSIPATIGNLKALVVLHLENNALSGSIPASVGDMAKVSFLYLSNNSLSGAIPPAIGNMSLSELHLDNNQLTGTIPHALGKLSRLTVFDASYNQLSGSIPASFKNLQNLGAIYLQHNKLKQDENIDLPLMNKKSITGDISYNNATFDGMEVIAKKAPHIVYAPQASIPVYKNGNTLWVNAGGTPSNNTYKWVRVGAAGSTAVTGNSSFKPSKSGRYFVKVTNAVAKKLTLYSDTIDFDMNSEVESGRMTASAKGMQPTRALQVYPSPASSIVHVQVNGTAAIVLTDNTGKVMLSKAISNKGELNVSTLANGVYYIKNTTTGDVQKIMVLH